MKLRFFCLILPIVSCYAAAQNPIVPPGTYFADPSGHVWDDCKIYLYCSRDESPDYYCSWELCALSSSDLTDWSIHRDVLHSRGPKDEIPYSDDFLYAPECFYRDGTYYMYYCLGGTNIPEGIAVSGSPAGPFRNGQVLKGVDQIDPAVFVDDDGQVYYYWGQFTGKVAKLNPDMKSIDMSTLKEDIVTEKEHGFHEGIQMFKRGGTYYLVYTDISRNGLATCIGYSTGPTPYGPFTYGGIIVDNFGCDPNTWNNHGSVVEFGGKWYIFYHRATHGSVSMRKACVEEIFFNEDGSIDEVEMTTQGAAGPLDPFRRIDAERACGLKGSVRIERRGQEANEELVRVGNNNTAAYKYFDFKVPPGKVTFSVTPQAGGEIHVFADYMYAPLLAVVKVPAGDGKTPVEISMPVTHNLTGISAIYLKFTGEERQDLFNVDWFQFE